MTTQEMSVAHNFHLKRRFTRLDRSRSGQRNRIESPSVRFYAQKFSSRATRAASPMVRQATIKQVPRHWIGNPDQSRVAQRLFCSSCDDYHPIGSTALLPEGRPIAASKALLCAAVMQGLQGCC
jgi:hypothetical protein